MAHFMHLAWPCMSDVSLDCLRLHSLPSFGLLWLLPRLKQFRSSHPDIQANLSCSYASLHFSRDGIQLGETPPAIRTLGGALFCDRRYDCVFLYPTVRSPITPRGGFRGALRV